MLAEPSVLREQAVQALIELTQRIRQGDYNLDFHDMPFTGLDDLEEALHDLAADLQAEAVLQDRLDQITARINAGLTLEDILNNVYDEFYTLVPYNRIGFSLIDDAEQNVTAIWMRSDLDTVHIGQGYSAPLDGSSLQTILSTGRPRVLNDLEEYLATHPESESTRLIVAEGIRSSLTCPLEIDKRPVGFLFFSSTEPHTYNDEHIRVFQRIARQLAVIVKKGHLVSKIKQREEEIKEKNDTLARLNQIKNSFVGIAAHDMRNPLGSILMGTSFLLETDHELTDKQRLSILQNVYGQAEHMSNLINNLLDVTRIEAGELELRMDFIDAETFLHEVIARNNYLAEPKNTRIVFGHSDSGSLIADVNRLRQVIDNLVSNAVKFSPPGSTVKLQAHHLEDHWRISVQDEGPGILDEDRPRLFQEFAKLSAQPTGDEKSTGLGLTIAARIVQAHHGAIDVDSVPGDGATFWFTLPDLPREPNASE